MNSKHYHHNLKDKNHPLKFSLGQIVQGAKSRPLYFLIGMINVIIFHIAIIRLWFFLYDSSGRNEGPLLHALIINSLLVLFFSVPHSYFLTGRFKKWLFRYIPTDSFGVFYSLHASIAILLMDRYWVSMGGDFYHAQGVATSLFQVLYGASWLFMGWAMWSTGPFRQSGIEQWVLGLKGRVIKLDLKKDGAYALCRHPIYASFLAMIWTTPNMSYGHLFLSLSWSFYIIYGAGLKEKRLMRNRAYLDYASKIPSFPFLPQFAERMILKLWRASYEKA